MKRVLCVCLLTALVIGAAGCNDNSIESKSNSSENSIDDSNTTSSDVSETSNKDIEKWVIREFSDEFGDPIEATYLNYIGIGTFSNTATMQADLMFSIIVNKYMSIGLYEYMSTPVTNTENNPAIYKISVKDEYGERMEFEGTMLDKNGDRIFLTPDDAEQLYQKFKTSQTIKFYIVNSQYPTSTYNFSVNTDGFNEVYSEFIAK